MATLVETLQSLVSAIGADIKQLSAASGGGGNANTITWRSGDSTPSLPIPMTDKYIVILSTTEQIPTWVPVGSVILRL
jgi:hypothetical protein